MGEEGGGGATVLEEREEKKRNGPYLGNRDTSGGLVVERIAVRRIPVGAVRVDPSLTSPNLHESATSLGLESARHRPVLTFAEVSAAETRTLALQRSLKRNRDLRAHNWPRP